MKKDIYDFELEKSDGTKASLKEFQGHPILAVNVASKCGLTPQYKGLENLYTQYRDKGFVIIAFPCNQFGAQEPGSNAEIQEFCQLNYGVSFPVFAKIDVNGERAHPLYQFLKQETAGPNGPEEIKWNFAKFLIDKTGKVVKRFDPQTEPMDLAKDVEAYL